MGLFSGIGKAIGKGVKAIGNAPRKLGKGLVKLATDPGEWAQNAGKSVGQGLGAVSSFIPGPLDDIAASVLQGGNMKDHALAGVGGMMGGGSLPGMGGIGKSIGGFAGGSLADAVGGLSGGSGLKKLAGGALDFVKDHPDELLAAGQGLYGAYSANKANQLRGKALKSAEGAYNERGGLRKMGIEGMMDQTQPDLSSLFADAGNPYAPKPLTPQPVNPSLKKLQYQGGM